MNCVVHHTALSFALPPLKNPPTVTVSLVDTWVPFYLWTRLGVEPNWIFTHCVRISWHGILLSEALLLVNNWVIDRRISDVMTVSNLLVPTISWGVTLCCLSMNRIHWNLLVPSLHVGQNLRKTLTISGLAILSPDLAWVPKRQFFVCKEISWLSVEISNILFTRVWWRGASCWSVRLLREHCVISIVFGPVGYLARSSMISLIFLLSYANLFITSSLFANWLRI